MKKLFFMICAILSLSSGSMLAQQTSDCEETINVEERGQSINALMVNDLTDVVLQVEDVALKLLDPILNNINTEIVNQYNEVKTVVIDVGKQQLNSLSEYSKKKDYSIINKLLRNVN